ARLRLQVFCLQHGARLGVIFDTQQRRAIGVQADFQLQTSLFVKTLMGPHANSTDLRAAITELAVFPVLLDPQYWLRSRAAHAFQDTALFQLPVGIPLGAAYDLPLLPEGFPH